MRAPPLSFLLALAVVATVPAASKVEEAGAAAGEANGGSIKPMALSLDKGDSITPLSWSLDTYGPQEKAANKKPKEQNLDVQGTPKMTPDTYDQKPIEKQAEKAVASTADDQPDKYVASLVPDEKDKEEAVEEVKKAKKAKKEKKEKAKADYLDDESTSSKKEKKEKSDDSESDVSTSSKKKKKKAKIDDSDEDPSLTKKEKKKHKKDKSDDELDSTSPKKHKKEKSIDSDASSSAYLKQEEKKSGDEATSLKKQKKDKKKEKKEKEEMASEENPEEDAAPVDVSPGGKYVSWEKPSSDATTTTDEYMPSPTKAKGGERQISAPVDAYVSPKQPVASGSPDELLPAAKSSATPSQTQPMAAGSPDEPLPASKPKSSGTFDPYLSSKQQVPSSQLPAMAGSSPDEPLPAAATASSSGATPDAYASNDEPGKPKMTVGTISGMFRRPIAKILNPVIKSVCGQTQFPDDCEESISGIPGAATAAATDSVGVLRLAMEAVREKVVVAMNAAADRMQAPGVDGVTKDALSACKSSYSDLKSSLDTVDDALKKGDVDTVQTNLDAVETDLTTCDDGFQEHNTPSVMADHEEELQKLAHNLLSIGSNIKRE